MNGKVISPGRRKAPGVAERATGFTRAIRAALDARPFSPSDRKTLYLQIGRALQAGIPAASSLEQMARLSHGRRRTELQKMTAVLSTGGTLHDATVAASPLFPGAAPALIGAGERTGNIPGALESLTESLKFEIEIRSRLAKSLAYPVTLVLASAFLLPLPRLVTCGCKGYFSGVLGTLMPFLAVALVIVGLRLAAFHPAVGRMMRKIRGAVFFVGSTWRMKALGVTLDNLGQSLSSGLGLVESMIIARDAGADDEMRSLCDHTLAAVKGGASLASSFGLSPILPDEVAVNIASGERTGNLAEALRESGSKLLRRHSDRVLLLTRVLAAAILAAVMIFAAVSLIGAFTQAMGIGEGGEFNDAINREIPGIFNNL